MTQIARLDKNNALAKKKNSYPCEPNRADPGFKNHYQTL